MENSLLVIFDEIWPMTLYYKMENSLLVIFDEIWPMTLYYSTGYFVKFLSNFKNS